MEYSGSWRSDRVHYEMTLGYGHSRYLWGAMIAERAGAGCSGCILTSRQHVKHHDWVMAVNMDMDMDMDIDG